LFQKKINDYKVAGLDICYLDESGHAVSMPRTHGYAEKGKRCFGVHDWGARGRINVIGALIGGLLFAVGLFNCSIDSIVFGTWVRELLLPNLSKPTVIVMDNASFHKNEMILSQIRYAGHIVEFLPPYSPDLNPIEHKWSEKKAYRRKYRCSIDECYA
jgi:transposase